MEPLCAQNSTHLPAIIPEPLSIESREGSFTLKPSTTIYADKSLHEIGEILADYLRPATGFPLAVKPLPPESSRTNGILLYTHGPDSNLGNEGYTLTIETNTVTLTAPTPAGAFYACQTLRQLLPPAIFSRQTVEGTTWSLPRVAIKDRPRFSWRGMHLDVARHFFNKNAIKRFLDLMALHKLNHFHWHLTDDQGWRIEIHKYPKLIEIGAWRGDYGGYYTHDDIREIVAYARRQCITIVPEIDMPGHALAALAAYPHLACTKGPFKVAETWGIFEDVLCPCKEETFTFVTDVLNEIIDLFPSPYIHIGGDECPTSRWEGSQICRDALNDKGLENFKALHSYFIHRVGTFLKTKGRRFIGWDEVLDGALPDNAIIMSWRSMRGGIEGPRRGHPTIMSPVSHCYFDFRQSSAPNEPGAPLDWGVTNVKTVYTFEPIPKAIKGHPKQAALILGAQGNIWTERIPTLEMLDYMAFPRMNALAEVVWTDKDRRDWESFSQRLQHHYKRLDILGVNYCSSPHPRHPKS